MEGSESSGASNIPAMAPAASPSIVSSDPSSEPPAGMPVSRSPDAERSDLLGSASGSESNRSASSEVSDSNSARNPDPGTPSEVSAACASISCLSSFSAAASNGGGSPGSNQEGSGPVWAGLTSSAESSLGFCISIPSWAAQLGCPVAVDGSASPGTQSSFSRLTAESSTLLASANADSTKAA